MKALHRSLRLLSVALATLALSNAANADWIEEKQDAGCMSYKWYSFPKDDYGVKRGLYRHSWNGPCSSGEAISGRGTLTTLIAGDAKWWSKEEGEFKQGLRVGLFLLRSSNYPEALRVNYKNGCMNSEPDCTPKTVSDIKAPISKTGRFGALSIDRMQGNTYGWSVDEASLAQAREKSLAECNKLSNATCAVVMEFGNTCASYAVDSARSSSVYGWAYAPTKPEADAAALQACGERGGGNSQCLVRVWGCTSNAVQAGKR